MRVIDEHESGLLRTRAVTWDDRAGVAIAQPQEAPWPRSGDLWIAAIRAPLARLDGHVQALLLDPDPAILETVRRGVALVGLPWSTVTAREEIAARQMTAWLGTVTWLESLPAGFVWQTRSNVFGGPLTAVPRALGALDAFYSPDSPVSRSEWQQVVGT